MSSLKSTIKNILDVLRQFPWIFEWVREHSELDERWWRHLYFYGPIDVEVAPGASFSMMHYGYSIENALFWKGYEHSREANSLKLWRFLAARSRFVADVGANTGVFALAAKSINPDAQIVCVEPLARICEKLRRNIEMNSFDIRVAQVAASDENGVATIYDVDSEHAYSASLDPDMLGDVSTISYDVDVVRLDKLFGSIGFEGVDLIKIDVERREPSVLRGMGAWLERHRPNMLVEILDEHVGAQIEQIVDGLGYVFVSILEHEGYVLVDSLGGRDRNYLLCREEEFESVRSELGI